MSVCHIFAAGDFCGDFKYTSGDMIIAADAGYAHLIKLNISPDILIGDFDTIEEMPEHFENDIRFTAEKDYTDTQLAIEEGISRGFRKFIIYGALGGKRLEHTVANLQMTAGYTEKGYEIILTDGMTFVYTVHNSSISFNKNPVGTVSIFSLTDKSEGVTLSGFKYILSDATLTNSFALGVSNEFSGSDAEISVRNGTLIIITKQRRLNNEN